MSEEFVGASIRNEYNLLNMLGEGGQASVYLGQHIPTTEKHALKVFHPFMGTESSFLDEGRLSMGLPHNDHILRTHSVGAKNIQAANRSVHRRVVMTMEYANGGSLNDLKPDISLVAERVHLIGQAATGLQAAHNCGIVHCDVKPANLLLAKGAVKVADFGIARDAPGDTYNPTTYQRVAATFAYAAPEQLLGKATRRSDVHSLGVTAFKLLTGKYPFMPDDPHNAVQWANLRCQDNPAAPSFNSILVDEMNVIYQEIEPAIARAMQLEPSDRPSSMDEFRHNLLEALHRGQAIDKRAQTNFVVTVPKTFPDPAPARHQAGPEAFKATRALISTEPLKSNPPHAKARPATLPKSAPGMSDREQDAAQRRWVQEKMRADEYKETYGRAHTRRKFLKASAIFGVVGALEGLLNYRDSSNISRSQENYKKISPKILALVDTAVQSSNNSPEAFGYIADIGHAMVNFSPERAKEYADTLFTKDQFGKLTQIGIQLSREHTKEALDLFFELQGACEMIGGNTASGRELRSALATISMAIGDKLPEQVIKSRGTINDAGRKLNFSGFDTLTQELVDHLKHKPYRGSWGLLSSKLVGAGRYADIEAISPVIADEDPTVLTAILNEFNITKSSGSAIGSMTRASAALAKKSPQDVRKFIDRLVQAGQADQAKILHLITAGQMPQYTYPLLKENSKDLAPFAPSERYEVAMSIASTHYKLAHEFLGSSLSDLDHAWLDFAIHPASTTPPVISVLDAKTRLQCIALLSGQPPQPHEYRPHFAAPW